MDNEIIKQGLLLLLRHGLTVVAAVLVTHGKLQQDQMESSVEQAVGIVFGAISFGVGMLRQHYQSALIQTAIDAHPGTPLQAVKEEAKSRRLGLGPTQSQSTTQPIEESKSDEKENQ